MSKGAEYWKNQMEITRGIKHVTEETRAGCLAYEETNLRAALTASIPLDQLEVLCSAEQEGRCVVLPCKPTDKLYNKQGHELVIFCLEIGKYDVMVWTTPLGGGALATYRPFDFGKTVFRVPYAEGAMKGGDK